MATIHPKREHVVTPGMVAALRLLAERGSVRVNHRHPDPARFEIAGPTSSSLRSRGWTQRVAVPGRTAFYVLTQRGADAAARHGALAVAGSVAS